ncbi:MAG: STAS domain-containing protein [Firmicutes bacterium]|nr:STAS domain-containing protein [Bacillota bacterium]
MLSIRTITSEQIPIIAIEGELKAANEGEIMEAIDSVLTPGSNQLILDLTGIRSIDAAEMQTIIEATHRSLGQGGRLALVVTDKDKQNALRESHVADIPGVLLFEEVKKAMAFLGERRIDIA